MEKITSSQMSNIIEDIYTQTKGEMSLGPVMSAYRGFANDTNSELAIRIHVQQSNGLAKINVFTIAYRQNKPPEVIVYRQGGWVNEMVSLHKHVTDDRERQRLFLLDEELKKQQEKIGAKLIAFLPIQDFLLWQSSNESEGQS